MSDFIELFSFLALDQRSDILKMATAGVAQISKDNKELFTFFSKPDNKAYAAKLCDLIDPRLPAACIPSLGDVLLAVVNLSVDSACCETLVTRSVPLKLIKLFETLAGKADGEVANSDVLSELSLMALNNLTATCMSACEQVLELSDEDLAGYQLGRMKTHYDRAPDFLESSSSSSGDKKKKTKSNIDDVDDTSSCGDKPKKNDDDDDDDTAAVVKNKSHRTWLLRIALNISRIKDGARLFLEDDDWRPVLAELTAYPHANIRGLAMQLVRNIANFRETHATLIDECKPLLSNVLHNVAVREDDITLLHGWVDVLTSLISSEPGMRGMDETNAKRLLDPVVKASKENFDKEQSGKRSSRVKEVENDDEDADEGKKNAAAAAAAAVRTERKNPLSWEVAKRISEEVLPFLDEIQDVWVKTDGADDDE